MSRACAGCATALTKTKNAADAAATHDEIRMVLLPRFPLDRRAHPNRPRGVAPDRAAESLQMIINSTENSAVRAGKLGGNLKTVLFRYQQSGIRYQESGDSTQTRHVLIPDT